MLNGHQARFPRRFTMRVPDNSAGVNAMFSKQLKYFLARFILSSHSNGSHLRSQAPQIFHDVSRPAKRPFAPDNVQNWNWRFGGNAFDMSPKVLVEHKIADNRDPTTVERQNIVQDLLHIHTHQAVVPVAGLKASRAATSAFPAIRLKM